MGGPIGRSIHIRRRTYSQRSPRLRSAQGQWRSGLPATRASYGTLMLRGVEVGAAVLIIAFGALLLTGTIASERVGMF